MRTTFNIAPTIVALCLLCFSGLSVAQDANTKSSKDLQQIKKQYRLRDISAASAWQKLSKLLNVMIKNNDTQNLAELYQTQAYLLNDGGFPLLSAKYASKAIAAAGSKEYFGKMMQPSWELLDLISSRIQIHDIIIDLASQIGSEDGEPPVFKKNWYYFVGEAQLAKGDADKAIANYSKLDVHDRYYYAARYQLAMTYMNSKNDLTKAGITLRTIASDDTRQLDGVTESVRLQYVDQANLALGRIQYERQKFESAIKYFRKIRRASSFYYDALFNQSWAFFLAGYPNHALGALHAAESPFFPNKFNPEVSVLRSIIYYWMCLYPDAKTSLADFIDRYSEPVNNLETWLSQKSLNADKAFQLFENLISGVSSESLGMDRKLLDSVANTPAMIFARERLATVLSESTKLEKQGLFKSRKQTEMPTKILNEWLDALTKELGTVYIAELEALRDEYRNLRSQSNFIYVELLMSEKEQVLGRELHADQKLDKVNFGKRIKGWGEGNMPWKASDKGEYWWDEVGFFVYQVQPKCNLSTGK